MVDSETTKIRPIETYNRPITWAHRIQSIVDGLSSYATAAAAVTADLTTPANNLGDAGGDTYTAIENLIGSAFNDVLTGNTGDNVLDGGSSNDRMTGGTGNDTHIVDNAGDSVTETSTLTTEIDTVRSSGAFALGTNVENLTLTGTASIGGTGKDNLIIGNDKDNALDALSAS